MTTIALVEDDPRLSELVTELLELEGYTVAPATTVRAARALIDRVCPDLLILDLGLPDGDGLDFLAALRLGSSVPVLVLTARGDLDDELRGLSLGADDYLSKPVHVDRLVARVAALLRRAGGRSEVIEVGALRLDPGRREISHDTRVLDLTTAEYDLLAFLMQRSGHIVSRDEVYRALRGVPYDGVDRTIDQRVSKLRRMIGDDPRTPAVIKTVRGAGYLLAVP